MLKAITDETRLAILDLLVSKQDTLTVEDLREDLNEVFGIDLTQPTVSHHLRIMHDSGLVDYTKLGLHHYYRVNNDKYDMMLEFLRWLVPQLQKGEEPV